MENIGVVAYSNSGPILSDSGVGLEKTDQIADPFDSLPLECVLILGLTETESNIVEEGSDIINTSLFFVCVILKFVWAKPPLTSSLPEQKIILTSFACIINEDGTIVIDFFAKPLKYKNGNQCLEAVFTPSNI